MRNIQNNKEKIKLACDILKVSEQTQKIIQQKYEESVGIAKLSGKKDDSLITAIIYFICKNESEKVKQTDLSKHFVTTEVSIRNIYRQLNQDEELRQWMIRKKN